MESMGRQRLWKINECFLGFTTDPDKNIQRLTDCCGELMGAACALYNRLQDGMLHTLAHWNAPPDFNPVDRPDGHICHDVIKLGGRQVFVVRDLHLTSYVKTDPNVSAYCLKTYIGAPVSCKHHCVGSLCVVYQKDYSPDEEEQKILQILAAALGVEEERRQEADTLRKTKDDLEAANLQLRQEIEEKWRAEAEVRRMNDELEQKVAERTRLLLEAQEELVRKEKLAILGRLSGSVGHELRNPLGVMNNAVYFLKMVMSDSDKTVREYLDIIKQEIDNSERIITDLLDFARTWTPNKIPTAVNELIEQSLTKCAIPENIQFQTDIPETLSRVLADPLQMSQVFQNLVTNAVQAMPEGGALRISARPVSSDVEAAQSGCPEEDKLSNSPLQNSNFIEISVIDTGEGITPENMKKLFQPLFTTKARAIGLGLTISRNLTEANCGNIKVESRLGEGTTFTVSLPAAGGEA